MDCCKQPIHRFAKEGLEKRETYQEKEQVSSDLDVSLTAQRFSPRGFIQQVGQPFRMPCFRRNGYLRHAGDPNKLWFQKSGFVEHLTRDL